MKHVKYPHKQHLGVCIPSVEALAREAVANASDLPRRLTHGAGRLQSA